MVKHRNIGLMAGILVVGFGWFLARAEDWKETEAKYKEYLKENSREGFEKACNVLQRDGSVKAAQKLVDLIKRPAISPQLQAEIAELEKWINLHKNDTVGSQEEADKLLKVFDAKRKELQEKNKQVIAMQDLSVIAAENLKGFEGDEIKKFYYNALRDKEPQVKCAVAEALGYMKDEGAVKHLVKLLKDGSPDPRIAAARALAQIGDRENSKDDLIKAFKDKKNSWQVQNAMGDALADLKVYDAIPEVIDALKDAKGRQAKDLDDILFKLTNTSMAGSHELWTKWLEANLEAIKRGEFKPGPSSKVEAHDQRQNTTFFNIPVDSKRLIFVIDVSGSMRAEMAEKDVVVTPAPGMRASDVVLGKDRLSVAKNELINVIRQLEDDAIFNIIPFNDTVQDPFAKTMVKAAPTIKAQAEKWVLDLKHGGGTNIYDALKTAFFLAGEQGTTTDKYYEMSVDTIYFLTDGTPEHGPVTDWNIIISEVVKWNKYRGVKVHCIEIGFGEQRAMMAAAGKNPTSGVEALAAATGGTFVSR